jgi:hypothetical protein
MSVQERACCRMMHGQCGEMQMPAMHGCCQKSLQSLGHHALNSEIVTLSPFMATAMTAAAFQLSAATSASADRFEPAHHSPPTSPPPSISILRI